MTTNTERKLATVRRIADIRPIEGADKIECIVVDGWEVVAQKGQGHVVGGFVVYFEIDSVLPLEPEFEFLAKGCYVKRDWIEGYRLKTIKMRGQRSQGLILPISLIEPVISRRMLASHGDAGQPFGEYVAETAAVFGLEAVAEIDLTDTLGVQKWEPPLAAGQIGQVRGTRPWFVPKTDQERLQNVFNKYKALYLDDLWEVTLKLDGSSTSIYVKDGVVGVCSRNQELEINEHTVDNMYVRQALIFKDKLIDLGRNLVIQGELVGPGIQENHEGFKNQWFFMFDVYDIDEGRYLTAGERYKIQERLIVEESFKEFMSFGLVDFVKGDNLESFKGAHIPIQIMEFAAFKALQTMEEFLDFANVKSWNNPIAEGLVFKNLRDPSVSFKVINNLFLDGEK